MLEFFCLKKMLYIYNLQIIKGIVKKNRKKNKIENLKKSVIICSTHADNKSCEVS